MHQEDSLGLLLRSYLRFQADVSEQGLSSGHQNALSSQHSDHNCQPI